MAKPEDKQSPKIVKEERKKLAAVKLTGKDENAFAIIAQCRKAMRDAGQPKHVIDAFVAEAMSDDYPHLMKTAKDWLEVHDA